MSPYPHKNEAALIPVSLLRTARAVSLFDAEQAGLRIRATLIPIHEFIYDVHSGKLLEVEGASVIGIAA